MPFIPGRHVAMAIKLVDHAAALGLVATVVASRATVSPSRYVTLTDKRCNRWIIRLSNHNVPHRTGASRPHVDIVSHDGLAGLDAARGVVDRIASGELAWFDAGKSPARARRRRR